MVTGYDIAGTRWPLHKLESVATGLVIFVVVFTMVGSLEPAALTATAVALAVWWGRRTCLRRRT